jgi:hypothetical protein
MGLRLVSPMWLLPAGFLLSYIHCFLAGVVTFFMTPAPSMRLELYYDVVNAFWGAILITPFGLLAFPWLCRRAPVAK